MYERESLSIRALLLRASLLPQTPRARISVMASSIQHGNDDVMHKFATMMDKGRLAGDQGYKTRMRQCKNRPFPNGKRRFFCQKQSCFRIRDDASETRAGEKIPRPLQCDREVRMRACKAEKVDEHPCTPSDEARSSPSIRGLCNGSP